MKGCVKILTIFVLIITGANAQDRSNYLDNTLTIGMTAAHYYTDPGLMVNITTPYFLNNKMAGRLTGGYRWHEYYLAKKGSAIAYPSIQLGLLCNIFSYNRINTYIEAGPYIIFPRKDFSGRKSIVSVYTTGGIDLLLNPVNAKKGFVYFFEVGFMAGNAHAEKLTERPVYSRGIVTATGFRFYF